MEEETYEDVIDSWNRSSEKAAGKSLTDYIKDNNIKIKEIEMDPMGDLARALSSKADGGAIGIEVLFGPKRKDFASVAGIQVLEEIKKDIKPLAHIIVVETEETISLLL